MFIDIAIICPREVEFREMRKILTNATSFISGKKRIAFEFDQISGENFDWNVAIIEPDLKLDSFAMRTNDVISALRPDYLILAGVAGGIKDVGIGDVVIGTEACDYESGKETETGFASRPRIIKNNNTDLLTISSRISRQLQEQNSHNPFYPKFYSGVIASGNKVIANTNSESYKIIKRSYNGTLAVEMEAYDFAEVASRENIKYINIRGISDLIDHKSEADAAGNQQLASSSVRDFLIHFIWALPKIKTHLAQALKVNVIKKAFVNLSWRTPGSGIITIYDKYIEVIAEGKTSVIRNVKEVKYVKMPGDISRNWIKVNYEMNKMDFEIYLSEKQKIDLGSWIGGSKQLLRRIELYQQGQIAIQEIES